MTRGLVHYRFLAPIALTAGLLFAQQTDLSEYGPPNGTLIIVGGGNLTGTGIMETFINRAGGLSAKIIVVPTAGGNKDRDGKWILYKEEQVIAPWIKLGATNVHMLHTHDPKEADTEEFAKTLRDAKAVWFNGGRQWNCVDSYMNTLSYREFHNVLAREA
jgi:cyanophycinase